ncbi:MAG: response regulator [Chloroflexi bacterium]|nr:response regulator [Chloroflexota bacterium]
MKRLLIVDDDMNLLSFFLEELTQAGFDVSIKDNGADAIIAAVEERFDLVLLDMLMPGLDGIKVIRVLRKVVPQLPIIGLTGYMGRGYLSQAAGLGVPILTKPVMMSSLVSEINRTLENSSSP